MSNDADTPIARGPDVEKLLERIEELRPEAAAPVREQHVVSQVLLKRFAAPGPGSAGLQVGRFDLDHPERFHKDKGTGGCGWVKDFVPFASGSLENLWGETEQRLPAALAAVDDGSVGKDDMAMATLRDVVALHFVRSIRTRDMHERVWEEVFAAHRRSMLREGSERVRFAAHLEHGIHVTGPQGVEYFADRFMAPSAQLQESGAVLRAGIEDTFQRARQMLAHAQLEIVTPLEGEFLIGDSPAVSLRYRTLSGNTVFGVALGDANTVVLPIGPRYLIALARETRTFKVPRSVVDELNTIQVLAAQRYVHHRPG